MTIAEALIGLGINLFAGILIFLLGLFWPVIPKSFRKVVLRRFWGKGVLGQDFVICYGVFRDSRLILANPPAGDAGVGAQGDTGFSNSQPTQPDLTHFRYVKRYPSGRQFLVVGPWEGVVANAEVRSTSYIINALSAYRTKPIPVVDDVSAFATLSRTFVALGSPSSNVITDLILRDPKNIFLEFKQEGETSLILDKSSDTKFIGFQDPVPKDFGIILKIPNVRFKGHNFLVCAGLGEWGTSGAAWYLATKWRDLKAEFGDAFGIVVEVELGSDDSARRVFPEERPRGYKRKIRHVIERVKRRPFDG